MCFTEKSFLIFTQDIYLMNYGTQAAVYFFYSVGVELFKVRTLMKIIKPAYCLH